MSGQRLTLAILAVLAAFAPPAEASQEFRDCPNCPQIVVVPAGQVVMGARRDELGHTAAELPAHTVSIRAPFAIGKYDVTRAEFAVFANATHVPPDSKCDWRAPRAHGRPMNQSESDPIVCVSWNDAQAYVAWLSRTTGHTYRLPSEAEWEYAARAGSATSRPWGDGITHDDANYGAAHCCAPFTEGKDRWLYTSPVGAFPPNAFGLYDMLGNVWQWVQDCSHPDYIGAPADGAVWAGGDCSGHMVRGGAWFQAADSIRSAARASDRSDFRIGDIGFRVARSLG